MNRPPLAGAVLTGGASTRMGVDKALVEVGGRALVLRAVEALRAAGADPVVTVGGDGDALTRLGLGHVADRHPGEGPLGGIITALRATTTETVAVLSCDLTDATALAVRSVAAARGDADVAVAVVDGQPEWLHAVWHRRALPPLEAAFAEGVRAPRHAAPRLRVAHLLDADPLWFRDADQPEDLPPASGDARPGPG